MIDMAEKEDEHSSGFDHVAALNKAGFAVRGVRTFRKYGSWQEFDLGSKPSEVKQQAQLMGLLDKNLDKDVDEKPERPERPFLDEARIERRERERQRLTSALNTVLNTVSPGRRTTEYKEFGYKRKSPTIESEKNVVQSDAEVRVAMRELFGDTEKVKSTVPLLQRILNYKIQFTLPRPRSLPETRVNIINQLKEAYK